MLDVIDSFTPETSSSKSCSARKVCRNSGFHSTVFTLHGLLFMQFLRFGAHAQELWPLVSTWYVPSHHALVVSAVVWSLQLHVQLQFGSLKLDDWLSTSLITLYERFRWVLCSFARNFLSPKNFPFGLFSLLTSVSAKEGGALRMRQIVSLGLRVSFSSSEGHYCTMVWQKKKKKKNRSAAHLLPPPAINKRKNVYKSNCVKRWREKVRTHHVTSISNTVPHFSSAVSATFR